MGHKCSVRAAEIAKTKPRVLPCDRDKSSHMALPVSVRNHQDWPFRWMIKISAAFVLAGGLAFGVLFLVTPSADTAMALVLAQARTHGISYPSSQLSPRFIQALVATEDQRFYSPFDPGIDPIGIARAILEQMTGHRGDPGGSTIPQQLAKMLYTPGRDGLPAKLEQVGLAIKLDLTYSKIQILSMYAEVVYFGDGHYGITAASCGYFGKQPADLTWAQAAMLAGAVNAPTADDPRTHPAAARAREAHVFNRLVAVGDLSGAQAEAAFAQPLALVPVEGCSRPQPKGGS